MGTVTFTAVASLAGALSFACGPSLPEPVTVDHLAGQYDEVPYPPPAALAETVPPPPKGASVVWIDGEWLFRGRTYAWKRGGWVSDEPNMRYAPPDTVYTQDGRILRAPGSWLSDEKRPVKAPRTELPAYTPRNAITPESQSPQT